ncbi:MAG: precorrin-6A reductase [Halanaerobium sp.]
MILVIAGTSDSYRLIEELKNRGQKITATVTTNYGKKLLKDKFKIKVIKKRMEKEDLLTLFRKKEIKVVIDASHPFAEEITKKAIWAAAEAEIDYLRFEREVIDLNQYQNSTAEIIKVKDYQEAARKAAEFEKIFLTTGSKNLEVFINQISNFEKRLFMRVMTFPDFIKKIIDLGLPPANLIAAKGPFTKEFNQALFKEYGADVIITKASGDKGGLKSKIEAAAELGSAIIIIQRPIIDYPLIFNKVDNLIEYIESIIKEEV